MNRQRNLSQPDNKVRNLDRPIRELSLKHIQVCMYRTSLHFLIGIHLFCVYVMNTLVVTYEKCSFQETGVCVCICRGVVLLSDHVRTLCDWSEKNCTYIQI